MLRKAALSARRLDLMLGLALCCAWSSSLDARPAWSHVAERPLPKEFQFASDSLFPVMHDPARSLWLLEKLRPILAKFPNHAPFRQLKFWGLANSGAPVSDLVALTDSLVAGMFPSGRREPPGDLQRATHCLELAEVLIARREDLTIAESYVRQAQRFKLPWQGDVRARCDADLKAIRATKAGPSSAVVSRRLPADTLANGIPRDVAAKLGPVARLWRYGLPWFMADSLVRGAASLVNPIFEWGGKDAHDIGERNLDVWSPDSTRWLNHDSFIEAGEEGGSVEFGGDVDSAPVLGDVKRDSVARLDFCGTPCAFDGAWWIDNSRFVLIGNIEADLDATGNREFFLDLYDLNAMRSSRWLGRPLSEAQFRRYFAACDSSLRELYRRNLARQQ